MKRTELPYVLALDHGTSGCKTAVVTAKGKIVDFEFVPTKTRYLADGGALADPEEWWRAFVKSTRKIFTRGKSKPFDIAAIAVSSTFSSTVAVDAQGKHLMDSLTWMDSRGRHIIRRMARGIITIEGYSITNLARWIRKTAGGPSLSGKDDIAHVLYIKHHHPDVYEKTFKFLSSKDYFVLRLTGECAASFDSMALFWVCDIRDINNIHYDESLIRQFGIDSDKLPSLRNSIDVAGTLSKNAAKALGLSTKVKVIMGAADHQCALVGSGAVRDFEGHLYIGTSSWIECLLPFKKTDALHSIATLPSAIPGRYQCINEQDVAGGALSFLKENILFHKNLLRHRASLDDVYVEMDKIASRAPEGSDGLIMTPWLNGERSPVDSATLRAGIFNISMTTTLEHLIRACYEGVAFNTKWNFEYVEKFTGKKFEHLKMIGGGAKSSLWCQIFADILNRVIIQMEEPMQANARGAAFLALLGIGEITLNDIPALVAQKAIFHPRHQYRELYDRLYREFKMIYKNNHAMYRRLNQAKTI